MKRRRWWFIGLALALFAGIGGVWIWLLSGAFDVSGGFPAQ